MNFILNLANFFGKNKQDAFQYINPKFLEGRGFEDR